MKSFRLTMAAALLGTAFSLSSQAIADDGFYVHGTLGASIYQDSESSGGGVSVENSFDTGYALGGGVGYRNGEGIRVEGELSYRAADIDTFDSVSAGGTTIQLGSGLDGSGDVSALSLMGNLAYDFDTGSAFSPYVLGGIGISQVSINDAKVLGVALADDSDTVFAYQAGVGVAYAVSAEASIDLGYRYFATSDPSFTDAAGGSFDSELHTHNILIGVRYSF